jgi:endonuclease/exonuclease/phosphatase family metal-dependent hydrolase
MERAPRPRRTPGTLILALLAALAVALATVAGPVAAKPAESPPGAAQVAEARTVTVMTRNLYLGADLGPILGAVASGNQAAVVGAATTTWNQVVASYPAERMAAIADEIVAAEPDAVGLQEVTRFTTYDFNPVTQQFSNPTVAYDFLDLLMAALADRGASYRVVEGATAENFTSDPIPFLASPTAPFPTKAVQLLDRDVIIVRDGVKVSNARTGQFTNILTAPLPIKRGWGSVDLMAGPARFRFVNTHLEAFGQFEALRVAQVMELFAAQAANKKGGRALPAVYAGDFNSAAPSGGGYQALLDGGLHDLWVEAPDKPADGDTCCQDADLRNEESLLDSRIDLLLGTRGVRAVSADLVGDEPVDLVGGVRWASDHAGVVADAVIPASSRAR